MRSAGLAIFGMSLLAAAAQAQTSTEPQVWQGEAFITGFTNKAAETACTTNNVASVGDYYLLVYRPIIPGSPNNPATSDEGLTFVGGRDALHYFTDDGVSFEKPGDGYLVYLSSHASSYQQTAAPAAIPFSLKITPAKISLKTPTISVAGSLDDWENTDGCNVTFTSSLVLRVD
jgi:hypothetical protein